jgi:hypothetical protein
MKTITFFTVLAWLVASPLIFHGAETPTPGAKSTVELKELAAVEQFLGLSDAELEQLQQVIARIRAMKPAERTALRTEIEKFRQLPEGQRQQMRQGWSWMPREVQDGWREMMQGATPERRAEIQAKLQSMDPDARLTYRQQLVEEYLKNKAAKK